MSKITKLFIKCIVVCAFALLTNVKLLAVKGNVSAVEGLNVRSQPSAASLRLSALTYNTSVDIISISPNGWGNIEYKKGTYGWVCLDYVSLKEVNFVITERMGVNLRSVRKDTTPKTVLTAIPYGKIVTVTQIVDGWGKTSYDGKNGWICLQYASMRSSASTLRSSDELVRFIAKREGFCSVPTADPYNGSIKNIGYGHVICAGERFGSITCDQALDLLRRDIAEKYEPTVRRFLTDNGITASQCHFDALVSYVYNLGPGGLTADSEFNRWLLGAPGRNLNNVNMKEFAAEALKAHHASRVCSKGLLYRRIAEMNIFFFSDYNSPLDGRLHNPHNYIIPECIRKYL